MKVNFRILTSLVILAWSGIGLAQQPLTIPTVYEAGHFYTVAETVDGEILSLLVDTAGGGSQGMYWVTVETAKRLGLDTRDCKLDGFTLTVADLPGYKQGLGLPPPVDSPCGLALMVQDVPDFSDDGQLGAAYFPGRIWTFDYPRQRVLVQPPSWRPEPDAHTIAVNSGFFPGITIYVADQPVNLLLDTGATAHPTLEGKMVSGIPTVNGFGVTSYIDHSTFERWRKAHPDWRVVENGDDLFGPDNAMRIIEVPKVKIAGWSIGSVWFTERPDRSFNFFDRFMKKPVSGAAGANIFRHFVMTIDYPKATAYFRCASGCR